MKLSCNDLDRRRATLVTPGFDDRGYHPHDVGDVNAPAGRRACAVRGRATRGLASRQVEMSVVNSWRRRLKSGRAEPVGVTDGRVELPQRERVARNPCVWSEQGGGAMREALASTKSPRAPAQFGLVKNA